MKRLLASLLGALVVAGAALALVWWQASRPAPPADVVGFNDTVRTATETWPNPGSGTYPGAAQFTIVDRGGRVVVARGPVVADPLAAVSARAAAAPIVVGGTEVATLYYLDPYAAQLADRQRESAVVATAAVGVLLLLVGGWAVLTYVQVVRPFGRLRRFAVEVAAGDLDAPLAMDRRNLFGAWTESFDLMRVELAAARRREAAAHAARRALIAQLGHDIRTPVAAISASAEVLALESSDAKARERLGVILAKSAQIQELMNDLEATNLAEIDALTITPVETSTQELAALLARADPGSLIEVVDIPDALVRYDPLRLQQVFDNVVANSAKYASTPIEVRGAFDGPFLTLAVTDSGPGVLPEEVESVMARGIRGANAAGMPGSGLGLFIAAQLMERMGGTLAIASGPGFTVRIGIPLA